jgi:chemotaxis protein MotB
LGRRGEKEEPSGSGIIVLYTSLMILLLAFFIMMNSMSKTEEEKVQAVYQSLSGSFGFKEVGVNAMKQSFSGSGAGISGPISPVEQDYFNLRGIVLAQNLKDKVSLMRSAGRRSVDVESPVLFEPDSEILSAPGRDFLAQVAEVIQDRTYPLSVYGHTDDAPSQRLDGKDNWQISSDRALAVVEFLISQKVNPQRLAAFGVAGNKPLVPNTSPRNRERNNRVELVFDASDESRFLVPSRAPEGGLDFRGFRFDLPGPGKER